MPRLARAEPESGLYHVTARGNRKQPIYADERDRKRQLSILGRAVVRMDWSCLSYCQMGNHFHLLVRTRSRNLGRGMHGLQGVYAQYFNRRHGFSGHLFQNRFDAKPVTSDTHLWMTAAYVANNPVRAGMCERAGDWPWSSHAAIVDGRPPAWLDIPGLESYFGSIGGNGLNRYLDFVDLAPHLKGDSPL
jgi:putative transposase